MLKIWSMKKQQEAEEKANVKTKTKVSPAQLRTQKDLSEITPSAIIKTEFPNPDDILNFNLYLFPDEGMYKGGQFSFTFAISANFPHDPPKVKCTQKLYHPNIDYEGNVCLNILREDWKPVLSLNAIFFGLLHLFLEPNPNDPLEHQIADQLRHNRDIFQKNVKAAMAGRNVGDRSYDNVLHRPRNY